MKNILKFVAVVCLMGWALVNCTNMNDLHDKYLKDGEIIYVATFDSLKAYSGYNRMVIHYWLSDPQVKFLQIRWDFRKKSKVFDVSLTQKEPGIIELTDLEEGTISFELNNLSAAQEDESVTTKFTLLIYGEQYQKGLDNRLIKDYDYRGVGDTMRIKWVQAAYEGSIGTELVYFNSAGIKCIDTIARPHETEPQQDPKNPDLWLPPKFKHVTKLPDVLDGSDLVYRMIYKPTTSVDALLCNPDTLKISPAIRVTGVTLDKKAVALEQRKTLMLRHTVYPENAFKKEVTWSSSNPNIARVSNGMVTGVTVGYAYIRVITDDGFFRAECLVKVNTAGYVDLDRSEWYVAPETDLNGNPLQYSGSNGLSVPSIPNPINLTSDPPLWSKKKSPYLSHFLGANAGAAYPASGDARISHIAHIDNLSSTYLSLTKGVGTNALLTGAAGEAGNNWTGFHRWGGMWITTPGEKPWFVIRLSETTPQKFNYFRIRYRENGSLTVNNKPLTATFFGSNDDNCIQNEALWIKINSEPIALANANATTETTTLLEVFTPLSGGETGNQRLPEDCEYRYIKVQVESWVIDGNTVCFAEFYLGWHDIEVAP